MVAARHGGVRLWARRKVGPDVRRGEIGEGGIPGVSAREIRDNDIPVVSTRSFLMGSGDGASGSYARRRVGVPAMQNTRVRSSGDSQPGLCLWCPFIWAGNTFPISQVSLLGPANLLS